MAKITQNNLEYIYDSSCIHPRGGCHKYRVITHRNRDRKGGHLVNWGRAFHAQPPFDPKWYTRRNTHNIRQINAGIEDHFDALEDEGKIFNFMGVDQCELDDLAWYEAMMDDYFADLENECLQEEMDREERERELDIYYDSCFDYDYDYSY